MRKYYLLLSVLLLVTSLSFAQTKQKIIFNFESKTKLQEIFKPVDTEKSINFKISGLSSSKDVQDLTTKFYSFSDKILNIQIKDINSDNYRDATFTFNKAATLSFFTKLLITNDIRDVLVGGVEIKTEKLND